MGQIEILSQYVIWIIMIIGLIVIGASVFVIRYVSKASHGQKSRVAHHEEQIAHLKTRIAPIKKILNTSYADIKTTHR